jgi:plasmid stabilization system protein ParE
MAVEIRFAPEFEQDLTESYGWYEEQRPGLGEEFLARVDDCLDGILDQPEMYSEFHETFRRGLLRRFPYALFYEYREKVVTVYGLFHHSRDPEKMAPPIGGGIKILLIAGAWRSVTSTTG